jgi:hypothetical protein
VAVDTVDITAWEATTPGSGFKEPRTFNLRWKAYDARSKVEGGTVYDNFDITIQYICAVENLNTAGNLGTGGLGPLQYTLKSTMSALTTSLTHTSGCALTMVCQYYDHDLDHWTDWPAIPNTLCTFGGGITFDIQTTATGSTGAMNEYATYQPEKFVDTRIVYTSTNSLLEDAAGRVVYDEFQIHFVEACYNLDITVSTALEAEYTYLTHAASGNLDIEASYAFANDASCTKVRTAYIRPEGPENAWVSIPSGSYPFLTLDSTYGVRVAHTQADATDYDTPTRYDVWIDV